MKKCNHKCLHTQTNVITGGFNEPQGLTTEYDIQCSKCNEIIGHWAYGSSDIDYLLKYELRGLEKFKANIKYHFQNLKLKIKYRKIKNDLPF